MGQLRITRAKRVGTVTSAKNEKACRGDRPINQTNLALDYIATSPKKLSTARLSAYWRVMMDKGGSE